MKPHKACGALGRGVEAAAETLNFLQQLLGHIAIVYLLLEPSQHVKQTVFAGWNVQMDFLYVSLLDWRLENWGTKGYSSGDTGRE